MDLTRQYTDQLNVVKKEDLPFEFFMNRFRLLEACPKNDYTDYTGLWISEEVSNNLLSAIDKGLLMETATHWRVTKLGRRYLNTLLGMMV